MALYIATSGKITLTASATKTLLLLNPSGPQIKTRQLEISMDASSAAAGVQFDLYRVTSLGSPAGTTVTPAQADPATQAATTTALGALTTEPTTIAVIASWYLQPLGGLVVLPLPYGAELVGAAAGARIGLRYTTPASVTPDCLANWWFEE